MWSPRHDNADGAAGDGCYNIAELQAEFERYIRRGIVTEERQRCRRCYAIDFDDQRVAVGR